MNKLIGIAFVLTCGVFFDVAASGADTKLLADRRTLEPKVAQIVAPYLHQLPDENDNPIATKVLDFLSASPNRAWAIVVGVVSKEDSHVFGFGRLSKELSDTPDGRTLFEIGSVTKTFTALMLADLVERGEMKFDDPVAKYLPDSVQVPKHGDKQITLLHLATHTSDLPRVPAEILRMGMKNPYKSYGADDMYKTLASIKLARDPGEQYAYSNFAVGLLGHVLSRQAGKSYEELVRERICRPLGLDDTRIDLDEARLKRLAPPHDASGKPSSNWDFDAIAGAGALRSTTDDMLRYLQAQMGFRDTPLLPAMRRCHAERHKAGNDIQSIGLGWHIEKMSRDSRLIFHGGGTGGYNTLIGFVEEDGQPTFGVVVLANAAPGGVGMAANDIAVKLLNVLHGPAD